MWHNLVGHSSIVSFLRRVTRSERVGHAYLFMGRRGVGKAAVARVFAAAILCLNNAGPCGECESCRLVGSGGHPDLFEIRPQGQSFRISQIRELNSLCLLRPSVSLRRVYILHHVEQLTTDAANSFLRTLEDPPSHVTFILLSDAHEVLSTIVSRCQVIRFGSLTHEETLQVLTARTGLSPHEAATIAKRGMGSPGDALSLADTSKRASVTLAEELALIWPHLTPEDKLLWTKRLDEARDDLDPVVEYLSLWTRDVMLFKLGLHDLMGSLSSKEIEDQANNDNFVTLSKRWQTLAALQIKMQTNVNKKLIIDELLLI